MTVNGSDRRGVIDRINSDGLAMLLWLVVVTVCLVLYRESMAVLAFRDPDDSMRLAQVRDLIAGQGWFDMTQHRVNPAEGGGLMHWSRFIDGQIVGLIWLLQSLLGQEAAERWAMALYPQLLILPLFMLFARILGALGDRRLIATGLLIAATSVTFLHYFAPLRIDHHNWQLLLSVAMLWLALGPASLGRGLAAALVITAHGEISLEGLPYLAIFGALFVLDWLRDPDTAPRLAGFAAGLVVMPVGWLLVFRGARSTFTVYCDSFSWPYLAGVAVGGIVLFGWLRGPAILSASWRSRAAGLLLAGMAALTIFVLVGRQCLAGPFGTLEPLVRLHWYDMVMEGRPVWAQRGALGILFLAPTFVGLGAMFQAWRSTRGSVFADNWTRTGFVILCSSLLSLLVTRMGSATHAYMIPAFAALAIALWSWGRARRTLMGRAGGALLVFTAFPAVDAMLGVRALTIFTPTQASAAGAELQGECPTPAMLSRLAAEPPALLFAPVDIGPTLLVKTPHSVIATGHHRNHAAMNRVISAFVSRPDAARLILRAEGARYLVLCPGLPEVQRLALANPEGLAAMLVRGESIDWLDRSAALSSGPFVVYHFVDSAARPEKTPAEPQILPQH